MRVLVTGGTGFVGRHLVALLRDRGHDVVSTGTAVIPSGTAPAAAGQAWRELRLPDRERCAALLGEARPEAIVHLAAVADVPAAQQDPARAVAVNLEGTLGLCQALERLDRGGAVRLVHVSTAHVYSAPAGAAEHVLTEESPLAPATVYGRTKLAAELAVDCLARASRRPAVIFRPFQHIGPGQRPAFALSSFARQIAQAELGRREPVIEVGDLGVARDFCDVGDVALAYALAVEGQVAPGTYNLASGASTPLGALLEEMLRLARRPLGVRVEAARLRPGEPASLRGSAQKIQAACGWRPKVSLSDSVARLLESWRQAEKDP